MVATWHCMGRHVEAMDRHLTQHAIQPYAPRAELEMLLPCFALPQVEPVHTMTARYPSLMTGDGGGVCDGTLTVALPSVWDRSSLAVISTVRIP